MGILKVATMHDETPKTKLISLAVACTASVVIFFVLHTLSGFEKDKYFDDERKAAYDYGQLLRAEVDRELNSLLFVSNGLSSYLTVYKDELDPEKINQMLQDLWTKAKHVKNLGIAVGYKLTYVYPITGNEKVIGQDFRRFPSQWQKVKLAIERREGVLDGPLNLIQGGKGIIYRYPVFIDDEYWGIISTVINTDAFLDAAFKRLVDSQYTFAIRAENKEVFYGNPALFKHKGIALIQSHLPNNKWELAIERNDLKLPFYFLVMDVVIVILSLLVGLALYYYGKEWFRLTSHSLTDSLTNLPNRRYLDKKLLEASSDATSNEQMFAVMLIDVDYFKHFNDTYGHHFGDEVIKRVAQLLQLKIRTSDTLSRMGGDEFVMLIGNLKSEKDIVLIATKIIKSFQAEQVVLDKNIQITVSIGVAINSPNENTDFKALMRNADEALYMAKGEGRNRFKFYSK